MKTVHTSQNRTSWRLLLSVFVATCAFAVAAYARPIFIGKFTLPYEVRWGQAVLRPGVYYLRMDSMADQVVVVSAGGQRTIFIKPPIIADSKQAGYSLTLTTTGNERIVRSLNLPEIGKSAIFAPLTNHEKEALAKAGQPNTVTVVTAKR